MTYSSIFTEPRSTVCVDGSQKLYRIRIAVKSLVEGSIFMLSRTIKLVFFFFSPGNDFPRSFTD